MTTPTFNEEGVGKWSEDIAFDVTAERLIEYAKATNDPIADHLEGKVAPPVFAIVPVFNALIPAALSVAPVELISRLVHGEQDFLFHKPIVPGMKLVSRAKPLGFEGKPNGTRGAVYLQCRDSATNELVNEQWVTFFFRKVDCGSVVGELGPNHTFDEKLREKAPVASIVQHVDKDQTFRYSPAAGDPMPIHLDDEIAQLSGLPGIIAHGLCMMAFNSWAVITKVAGGNPARLKRLAVRFAKPVLPEQDLTTRIWSAGANDRGRSTFAFESTVGDVVVIKDGLAELTD